MTNFKISQLKAYIWYKYDWFYNLSIKKQTFYLNMTNLQFLNEKHEWDVIMNSFTTSQ